jgi:hypothetical protein
MILWVANSAGRERPGGRRKPNNGKARESDCLNRTPERPRRYRFARSLATRIYAPDFNNPHQSLRLSPLS